MGGHGPGFRQHSIGKVATLRGRTTQRYGRAAIMQSMVEAIVALRGAHRAG
ncbi:hypothetical protein L682_07810 [Aquipseudomonas alcaligenes OT 69]|nr:hypothetical protein L682_07810 [Pseudomonas alcaligenes OT 69]